MTPDLVVELMFRVTNSEYALRLELFGPGPLRGEVFLLDPPEGTKGYGWAVLNTASRILIEPMQGHLMSYVSTIPMSFPGARIEATRGSTYDRAMAHPKTEEAK